MEAPRRTHRTREVISAERQRESSPAVTPRRVSETGGLVDETHVATPADGALLLDEADALFGRRTEVKDAHDRHAAAQPDAD